MTGKKLALPLMAFVAGGLLTVASSSIGKPGGQQGSGKPLQRTFSIPHVLEQAGETEKTPYTFDTTIYATYSAGLASVRPGNGATVQLYLYDENGRPLQSAKGDICNPCTEALSNDRRKVAFKLEDRINAAGGFPAEARKLSGMAIISVEGDADSVNLQGFVVNSQTSVFDLSVFVFSPEEVKSTITPQ